MIYITLKRFLINSILLSFRYIWYLIENVPFPSARRPRILLQLDAMERISLAQPEDSPISLRSVRLYSSLMLNFVFPKVVHVYKTLIEIHLTVKRN